MLILCFGIIIECTVDYGCQGREKKKNLKPQLDTGKKRQGPLSFIDRLGSSSNLIWINLWISSGPASGRLEAPQNHWLRFQIPARASDASTAKGNQPHTQQKGSERKQPLRLIEKAPQTERQRNTCHMWIFNEVSSNMCS